MSYPEFKGIQTSRFNNRAGLKQVNETITHGFLEKNISRQFEINFAYQDESLKEGAIQSFETLEEAGLSKEKKIIHIVTRWSLGLEQVLNSNEKVTFTINNQEFRPIKWEDKGYNRSYILISLNRVRHG